MGCHRSIEEILDFQGKRTASKDVRKEVMFELSRRENEQNGPDRGSHLQRGVVEYAVTRNYPEHHVICTCGA